MPLAFWVFALVFALRLIALARLTQSDLLLPASGDMQFYNNWALRILHGNWTDHQAFYGLPLYPYLLAAIYRLCGVSPFVPGLLQALVESGTAVLLYQIARRLFPGAALPAPSAVTPNRGELIGVLAALGWGFCQPAQAYSIILMPTSWFVFVFWFVVWQIMKRKEAPRGWVILLLGLLLGVTAMAVANILFLVPLLFAAIVLRCQSSNSRRAANAGLVIAGVLIGTSPAWLHNYLVAREPVFLSAHGGINFWIGNNPMATGYPRFPPGLHAEQEALLKDSITVAERAEGHPLRRSRVSSYWSTQAMNWIGSHPLDWVLLLTKKVRNFWNAFQYDDLSIMTELREEGVILPGITFGLIAALGLPGMLIACCKIRESRWIATAILLQMGSLLAVFVTERYRLVALPGLLLFAGFVLLEIWDRMTTAEYTKAALVLLLVAASTAFVSLPQRDETLWSLDAYNSGLKALEAGLLSEAERKLNLAYSYSPYNAGVNFAQGNMRFARGDRNAARSFYTATLELDPQHLGAWNNLGVLALQEQQWDNAVTCFARALALNGSAKTFYLLAEAQFHAGNLLAADAAIVRALQLSPGQSEFRLLAERIASASNIPPLP